MDDIQPPPPQKTCSHTSKQQCITPDMGILGKNIKMEFENENGTANTWWAGMVTQYNPTNDQYAAFFPSDHTTVYFKVDDEDYRIVS